MQAFEESRAEVCREGGRIVLGPKELRTTFSSAGVRHDRNGECEYDLGHYHRLSYCIRNELIELWSVPFDNASPPDPASSRFKAFLDIHGSAGNSETGILKWSAYDWYRRKFGRKPLWEVSVGTLARPDLIDSTNRVFIECGTTKPRRAYEYFGWTEDMNRKNGTASCH